MADTTDTANRHSLPKHKDASHRSSGGKRKNPLFIIAVVAVVVILAIWLFALVSGDAPRRTESYRDVSGSAGLHATITYDGQCAEGDDECDKSANFNVYIFTDSGRQVSVVQPDQNGTINLALPEGEYVMLLGKQFGADKTFPQEPLSLKNGKELELELKY